MRHRRTIPHGQGGNVPVGGAGRWRALAAVCILLFMVAGSAHIALSPVLKTGSLIQAPDEPAHLVYVQSIAEASRLPRRNDPVYETYEWHQPPLYYALAAPLYGMGPRAVRAFSLVLATLTLLLVGWAVRRLTNGRDDAAALAIAFAALVPMRQAVLSSAGNDALAEFLCTAVLCCCMELLSHGRRMRTVLLAGILLGLAVLTKLNTVVMAAPLAAAIALAGSRQHWREAVGQLATAALVVCVITAGWFAHTAAVTGEAVPLRAFRQEFAHTAQASNWIGQQRSVDHWTGAIRQGAPMTRSAYYELTTDWSFRTYWASYTDRRRAAGGIPLFLEPRLYLLCLLPTLLALLGPWVSGRFIPAGPRRYGALLLAGTWLIVLGSLLAFQWTYFQAQGRYLYPASLAAGCFPAFGLMAITPERRRFAAAVGVVLLGALLSAAFVLTSYTAGAAR